MFDFPVGSQCSWCDGLVADQLVGALVGHFYSPVRLNAQGARYRPSRSCGIDLLDGHDVPQETGQILKITIKFENLLHGRWMVTLATIVFSSCSIDGVLTFPEGLLRSTV